MDDKIQGLLQFIQASEKLKTELRHSWTSERSRQESVADHSWMLSLIAMVLPEMTDIQVDRYRVLKMVVLHDLAEVIVGDIPSFEKSERQDNKYKAESLAMVSLVSSLPGDIARDFIDLWEEMEAKETVEAKMAHAIDKAEVLIQHGIASIDTWDDGDYSAGVYHKDDYFNFDPFIRAFRDRINKHNWEKLKEAGTTNKLPEDQIARANEEFS